jgi:hypothetical protein
MVYFVTKTPILGKFLIVLIKKLLVYFMSGLRPFGIFYSHLVCYEVILVYVWGFVWYICPILVGFTKKNLATLVTCPVLSALLRSAVSARAVGPSLFL